MTRSVLLPALFIASCSFLPFVKKQEDLEVRLNIVERRLSSLIGEGGIDRLSKSVADLDAKLMSIEERIRKLEGSIEVAEEVSDTLSKLKEKLAQVKESIKYLEFELARLRGTPRASKDVNTNGLMKSAEEDIRQGKLDEALTKLSQVASSGRKYDKARFHMLAGDVWFRKGLYKNAIAEWSEIIEGSKNRTLIPRAYLRIAQAFLRLGEEEKAKTFLREIITRFPESPEAKTARSMLK